MAWQYRDGDRIELSGAGRAWVRFTGLVGLVILLVMVGMTINTSASSRVRTERLDTESFYDKTVYYVGDPVESPGCTVRIFVCLNTDVVFPIEVTGYEEIDPAAGRDGLSADTDLVLQVEDEFFPTHLVASEEGDRVTVSLYGKCTPRYPWDDAVGSSASECDSDPVGTSGGLVPVVLGRELGDRAVVDGHRDAPVERQDTARQ